MMNIIHLAIVVLAVVSMWKVFVKAGKPGWASIIPIYNMIVMLQIAGKPIWWIILLFLPIANIVVSLLVGIAIAENFGKGAGFGVGLALVGIVFFPILAFGNARYLGAVSNAPPMPGDGPDAPPVSPPSP